MRFLDVDAELAAVQVRDEHRDAQRVAQSSSVREDDVVDAPPLLQDDHRRARRRGRRRGEDAGPRAGGAERDILERRRHRRACVASGAQKKMRRTRIRKNYSIDGTRLARTKIGRARARRRDGATARSYGFFERWLTTARGPRRRIRTLVECDRRLNSSTRFRWCPSPSRCRTCRTPGRWSARGRRSSCRARARET